MVTPEFPPDCGGIGYYVYYLAKEIRGKGHDVSVILRGKTDTNYLMENIRVNEVKVSGVPPLNSSSFSGAVERVLSVEKPDIAHVHYGAAVAIRYDCPVMVTAHSCNRTGIPRLFRPVRSLESLARNALLPMYVYYEGKLLRSCHRFTTVSGSLRDEYIRHYGVEGGVVYNGIDPERFSPNGCLREDMVLFSGMLRRGKGVLDLLGVAELLKGSHPGASLLLIGGGPLRDKVRRAIRKRRLFNVHLVNRLSHADLLSYYRRAKIFVLPTYYEGLPNTVLEAMACELPVVASLVSGIPEQVEEGSTGYMVPPGDVKGFYARIVELLENPGKRESFGRRGRARVLETFTWQRIAKTLLDEYLMMLKLWSCGQGRQL